MPSPDCVAVLVTDPADHVLLVLNKRRAWELPGGSMKSREVPSAAAIREVQEETGLQVQLLSTPPRVIPRAAADGSKSYVFYAQHRGALPVPNDPDGLISVARWFSRENVRRLLAILSDVESAAVLREWAEVDGNRSDPSSAPSGSVEPGRPDAPTLNGRTTCSTCDGSKEVYHGLCASPECDHWDTCPTCCPIVGPGDAEPQSGLTLERLVSGHVQALTSGAWEWSPDGGFDRGVVTLPDDVAAFLTRVEKEAVSHDRLKRPAELPSREQVAAALDALADEPTLAWRDPRKLREAAAIARGEALPVPPTPAEVRARAIEVYGTGSVLAMEGQCGAGATSRLLACLVRDGRWYASGRTWDGPRRYRSDDRDLDGHDLDLVIAPPEAGGNGDWYVSVVPHGNKPWLGVRVTTSGAPRDCEGFFVALANAYEKLPPNKKGSER